MYSATTSTEQFAPGTAQPPSGGMPLALAVPQSYQNHVRSLPEDRRRETLQEMLWFIKEQFPEEMSAFFERSLENREVTHAENSSEPRVVSISPMEKLIAHHDCPELTAHLNSMVEEFNANLKHFISYSQNSELPSNMRERASKKFSKQLEDFGNDIHKMTSQDCESSRANRKVVAATQKKLAAWHNSVKILCQGLLDPFLDDPEGFNHNSTEKDKALSALSDIQSLKQDVGKKDYFKIDILLNYLAKGGLHNHVCSRLSDLILTDFIGSGNLIIFQKTLQRLFEYYQFIPYEGSLGEITNDLYDSIKLFATMKT
ncbi:hypothetical protein ACTL6P_07680 [Endozoicomonas acroporae]|uniref:hypothetical protein n=1 Tax=Endozoicomonas acroporae TaxID=1701104 RepID=UPI000C7600B0|nr:hypothetical protein [Endozoicomonas acroporae]